MGEELESLPGVGPKTADDLVDAGFDSKQGIAVASPYELSRLVDLSEKAAAEVIQAARQEADIGGFETGSDALERKEQLASLTTGHEELDDLLDGGVETQAITEVYGNAGTGRTAFVHTLAVRSQLPEPDGLAGQVAYIDTRGLFDPDRISNIVETLPADEQRALANQHGRNPDDMEGLVSDVLEHIHVSEPTDSTAQLIAAEETQDLAAELENTGIPLGTVIEDSLMFHLRSEYQGRGELPERQQRLNKHLHDLLRIGDIYNAAVVVTNARTSGGDSYGGRILDHTGTVKLQLRETSGEVLHAVLEAAPHLSGGKVRYLVEGSQLVRDD